LRVRSAIDGLLAEVRARLQSSPGRSLNLPGVELRESAVLVPLVERGGEPHLLFTRRPKTLRSHAGQFSFPGGGRDEADATPLHTALRESWEELGIPPERVEVLGMLDELPTITRFRIAPFVGVIPSDLTLCPCREEVDLVLEVSLRQLLRPGMPRREVWSYGGESHEVHFFDVGEHVIWGATARIVANLLERIGDLSSLRELR
jgi:8-oxo-dGTP pyrophosphatase MutT (NUDIX family)